MQDPLGGGGGGGGRPRRGSDNEMPSFHSPGSAAASRGPGKLDEDVKEEEEVSWSESDDDLGQVAPDGFEDQGGSLGGGGAASVRGGPDPSHTNSPGPTASHLGRLRNVRGCLHACRCVQALYGRVGVA